MSGHTPGPWQVCNHPFREYPRVTNRLGAFVADANEANARLIAAAPELLEAVRFANGALSVGGAPTRGECQEMRERFAAALAKFGGAL